CAAAPPRRTSGRSAHLDEKASAGERGCSKLLDICSVPGDIRGCRGGGGRVGAAGGRGRAGGSVGAGCGGVAVAARGGVGEGRLTRRSSCARVIYPRGLSTGALSTRGDLGAGGDPSGSCAHVFHRAARRHPARTRHVERSGVGTAWVAAVRLGSFGARGGSARGGGEAMAREGADVHGARARG